MDEVVGMAGVDPIATDGAAVRPQIIEIFAEVFQYHGPVDLAMSREDLARWDSLQHVALVVALENAFGISLSMDEMVEINSVRDIHVVLARHGV
jgi:acyl carrier protein